MRKRARTPEDEQAYLPQLGDLYLALGRLDDAESVQRRILEIQPENSQVFLALALIHDKRGDLRSAVEAIRTAVQMNPNHFPAYRQAGRLYYRAGLFAEAAEAFEKVLTYDENTTGVLYLLGMSRFSQRDWTAADKHFNELLLSSPDHADGWFAYARTNIKLHRLDEAEKALNTAKARGFGDRMMIRQVSASLQRARQRASRGALEQGR
jgi:superkiller protein 3